MTKYEVLYITKASRFDDEITAITEKYAELVKNSGGEFQKVDKLGIKRFAYPSKFKTEGYYDLMTDTAPAELPKEMERQMGISDDVYRFMTTKAIA